MSSTEPDATRYSFTRSQLVDAIACCVVNVKTSGPAAGMILAESMADAIIEALGLNSNAKENQR